MFHGHPGAGVSQKQMEIWKGEARTADVWRRNPEIPRMMARVEHKRALKRLGAAESNFNSMFLKDRPDHFRSWSPDNLEGAFRAQMREAGPNRAVMPPAEPGRVRQGMQKLGDKMSKRPSVRALNAWRATGIHKSGVEFVKGELGLIKGMGWFGKALGRGFLGASAYYGYQQGGVQGAVVETGKHLAMTYAMGAVLKAVGVGAGAGLAVGAGVATIGGLAAGYHFATGGSIADAARPWMADHARRQAGLEMGSPIVDNFGTTATMRQRSLSAIQNSRLNGRTALGNEAALSYQPY